MRCLNCHTVVADSDRRCISCGAPIGNAAYRQKARPKPFFAVAFLMVGMVIYNIASPPAQAVAANRGKINVEHIMWAGVIGALCAGLGGLLDHVLGGERRKQEASAAAPISLERVSARPSILDTTPNLRPKRPETSPPPRG
jgi:hypothetical protein